MVDLYPNAVVVHANHYQSAKGWSTSIHQVESRMILWCKAGYGEVTVDGQLFQFEPYDFLCLPWRHRIAYQAHWQDPFFLGGIHIIPDHKPTAPVVFAVAHEPSSPLAENPSRRDCELPGLDGIVKGRFQERSALLFLAEYTVQLFHPQPPEEWLARLTARQLLFHLTQLSSNPQQEAVGLPPELLRLMDYVHNNLKKPITLHDLASLAEKSPATLHRLFQQHLHTSPVQWVADQRFNEAQRLCRTTHLTVSELADHFGFGDIYHFSKFFKRKSGLSIREYRNQQGKMF
ncbi:MAG: AraC family transcriptional regulator [Kiritimatiellales bacterium]|nr:AraC family transcriptional regulator [Kiritimatiellales bacterium]